MSHLSLLFAGCLRLAKTPGPQSQPFFFASVPSPAGFPIGFPIAYPPELLGQGHDNNLLISTYGRGFSCPVEWCASLLKISYKFIEVSKRLFSISNPLICFIHLFHFMSDRLELFWCDLLLPQNSILVRHRAQPLQGENSVSFSYQLTCTILALRCASFLVFLSFRKGSSWKTFSPSLNAGSFAVAYTVFFRLWAFIEMKAASLLTDRHGDLVHTP